FAEGVAVIDPVAEPKQVASVFASVTVIAGPAATSTLIALLTQPAPSVTTMVCAPAPTFVNVAEVAPVRVIVPSSMNVYGPAPLDGVTVICPFVAPLQEVGWLVAVASSSDP